jgi:predicted porin
MCPFPQNESHVTSVDDAISYDMSPYLNDGDGVTSANDLIASVNDFITYDMSSFFGSTGGGEDGGADLFQQTSERRIGTPKE